jgi:hypothetical protein
MLRDVNRPLLQGGTRCSLSQITGLDTHVFQLPSKVRS